MTDLLLRAITEADYAFVKSTWLKNYKEHGEFARAIRNQIYFENHARIVDQILSRAVTIIAAHADESEVILGFLVCEPDQNLVHYAYVMEKARRLGVAAEMAKQAGIKMPCTYTHRTKDAKVLCLEFPGLTYNPYLI